MKKFQIAAQLYTLRKFTQTPADIAITLKRVRSLGFDAVQVSGMGPIAEEELRKIADDNALTICATHEPGGVIVDDVQKTIDRLKKLNCSYTAYPWPHTHPHDYASAVEIAQRLEKSAQAMKAAGLTLCYHNHAFEFERYDGKIFLDIIYENAPTIQGELDTFWVQSGGCNPLDWVNKLAGREPLLHLKDYAVKNNERRYAAVGSGNLDWAKIVPAAEAAGVKYFIIEEDDCYEADPFDELKKSLDYLTENFVR